MAGLVDIGIPKQAFYVVGGILVLGVGGYLAFRAIKGQQQKNAEGKAAQAGSPEATADVLVKLLLCDYGWGRVSCGIYVDGDAVIDVAKQITGRGADVIFAYRKLTQGRSLLTDLQFALSDSNYLNFRKQAGI